MKRYLKLNTINDNEFYINEKQVNKDKFIITLFDFNYINIGCDEWTNDNGNNVKEYMLKLKEL